MSVEHARAVRLTPGCVFLARLVPSLHRQFKVRTDKIGRTLSALSRQRQEAAAAKLQPSLLPPQKTLTPRHRRRARPRGASGHSHNRRYVGNNTLWAHLRRLGGVPELARPQAQLRG